jgi:hypothetical protein
MWMLLAGLVFLISVACFIAFVLIPDANDVRSI